MASDRFGYPSDEPCRVCGRHDRNQSEPRFCYTVCWEHQKVLPVDIPPSESSMNRPTGPRIPLRPRGPRIRAVGNVRDGVAMGDMHVQGGQPFVPASPEALKRYRAWIAENNLGIHADDVSLQTMKINGKRAQDFEL